MKLALVAMTAVLTLSAFAQAAPLNDVRKAVLAVDAKTIEADVAAALKTWDISAEFAASKDLEYTVCPRKEATDCYRYLVFSINKKDGLSLSARSLVIEYHAARVGHKVTVDAGEPDVRDEELDVNPGTIGTLRLVLPQIEKDYEQGNPVKGKMAIHPFSITITQLHGTGERIGMDGNDDHWDMSVNSLVSLGESFDSRVSYWQGSYTYLVRTVQSGDKIVKSDVRKVNLGPLLSR